ncbi:MAG: hypothetical protein WCJ19_04385 [bacterium]
MPQFSNTQKVTNSIFSFNHDGVVYDYDIETVVGESDDYDLVTLSNDTGYVQSLSNGFTKNLVVEPRKRGYGYGFLLMKAVIFYINYKYKCEEFYGFLIHPATVVYRERIFTTNKYMLKYADQERLTELTSVEAIKVLDEALNDEADQRYVIATSSGIIK